MKILNKESIAEDLSVYPGSELTPIGILGRSIPNYENLRKILTGQKLSHETNFMPRIPKEKRANFKNSQAAFSQWGYMMDSVRIPQYLLHWNETRKACVVEDNFPIPLVNLKEENWLDKLPYRSFFLKVKSPFVFSETEEAKKEILMDTFLIHDDPHCVSILGWSHGDEEKFLFTEEERERILEDTAKLKKKKQPKLKLAPKKVHGWFMLEFKIFKGTNDPVISFGNIHKRELVSEKIYNPENPLPYRNMAVLEMINGFCKIMATLPPAPSVKIQEIDQSRDRIPPPRQWFELPQQTIDYLETEKVTTTITIKRTSGTEKSPHVRRGHTRRVVGSDGKVTEIWIEQVVVREDKLSEQQLLGGAISLKAD